MHVSHEMHSSASTLAFPLTMLIASVGQTLTQDSHPVHFFLSTFAAIGYSSINLIDRLL
jgi:hypothetical protein